MANGMKQVMERKDSPDYEYQIYVNLSVVWSGLNPRGKYEEFLKKNPHKRVSIGWKLKEGILIAF